MYLAIFFPLGWVGLGGGVESVWVLSVLGLVGRWWWWCGFGWAVVCGAGGDR